MYKKITQGRYTANISRNQDSFLVVVTRDGDCLHGIPSRHYYTEATAIKGAKRLIAKAAV